MSKPEAPPENPNDFGPPLAVGGQRQIWPGWYVIDQQQTFGTGPWVDSGRLHVSKDPTTGGTIETYYLNLDSDTTGGGLLQATGAPGLEPRRVFESPGQPGRLTDGLRFRRAPGSLSQPPGIRSSRIVCRCAAAVILPPP